jgi:hypothetical protein
LTFLAQHIGRPLPAQRTLDVLSALGFARGLKAAQGKPRRTIARGEAAVPCLMAACFQRDLVGDLHLEGMLLSWADIVRCDQSTGVFATILPGALQAFDLPDLVAALAPSKVLLGNVVGADGRPIAAEEARKAYQVALEAYRALESEEALSIR